MGILANMYGPIHPIVIFIVSPAEIPVRESSNKEKGAITTPSSPKKKINLTILLCSSLQGAERRESSFMPRIYVTPKKDQEIRILGSYSDYTF